MNETWYKLSPSWASKRIVPVEIQSFTDKTVLLIENSRARRRNRVSDYECFFPTPEEAKAFAIKEAEIAVDHRRIEYVQAVSALAFVRKLEI